MKVSIISPVYKPTKSMWHVTASSVLNQRTVGEMPEFEWIIVLDGTTRWVTSTIPGFYPSIKDRDNVRVVTLWQNFGIPTARNVGFQVSNGDIIAYLDIGDVMRENRVADLVEKHSRYPEVALMFTSYMIVQGGQPTRLFDLEPLWSKKRESIRKLLQETNISIPLGVSHTRQIYNMAGGFQPGIVCGEDGILWRRMVDLLEDHEIMCNDEVAGTYYITENSQSRTQRRYEEGGFAFDASHPEGSHGQYLDLDWFEKFHSRGLYDPSGGAE